MILDSPIFLFLFLPAVLALYFAAPQRLKNSTLLAASLFFYAWGDGVSLLVLFFSVMVNYSFGLLLGRCGPQNGRKLFLGVAIGTNVSLLLYYKYLPFALANLSHLNLADPSKFDLAGRHLPLGISFFTFGAISYLVDVYRNEIRAESNMMDWGLYMSLFPKIAAGPIARFRDMSEQLKARTVSLEGFAEGVRRFAIGLGKKFLVANTVASVANEIFKAQGPLDAPTVWLGVLCYTIQIYFDFSGYSDMAIGLGRMLGFTFGENFDYPYISQSIQEFWRRWHITLSTWFRDYLYIPLGGNQRSVARVYLNLVVVFLLCGFWHGASWNFIVWGLYHGAFLVLERLGLGRALQNAWRPLRHLYTLLVIMVGWVFFRAGDLPQALGYIRSMFSPTFGSFEYYYMTLFSRELYLTLGIGVIGSMPVWGVARYVQKWLQVHGTGRLPGIYDLSYSLTRVALVILILIASAMKLAVSTYSPFIYSGF